MHEDWSDEDYESLTDFHTRYTIQREKFHDVSLELSGRHSKTILALSGGALTLSGTFFDKIFPNPAPSTLILIMLAWGAFLISLITHLVSLKFGAEATRMQMDILSQHYNHISSAPSYQEGVNSWQEPKNEKTEQTKTYSELSLTFLIIGIILLFFFSAANLYI